MNTPPIPLPAPAIPVPLGEVQILDPAALPGLMAKKEPEVTFSAFDDGAYFKYVPRKDFPPQCLIVDAEGTQIAVARTVDIAEFICNSCNALVIASLMNKAQDQTIVEPGSPLILPGGPVMES